MEARKTAVELIKEAYKAGCRLHKACKLLEIDARTYKRWKHPDGLEDRRNGPITEPANKLTLAERAAIIKVLTEKAYCDLSPCQIVPKLADQGRYIGSESSFYRILKAEKLNAHRERSKPRTHNKPKEYIATKANQVWSWDITYLSTIIDGKYFYLYLIIDIFSRKVVGFEVFEKESSDYAAELVANACINENINADELVLHSDNGSPMKGATLLATLKKLGVVASFSRPSVSDDNPYSEAMFKTLKYNYRYPSKPFATLEEAQAWIKNFVQWYNEIHQHSGINFVTPITKHAGEDIAILARRKQVYTDARELNPNRWSGAIRNWPPITKVALNPHKKLSCVA